MKFKTTFRGVPEGEIYPVQYQPGEDCPPELEESALALDAIDAAPDSAKPARSKKPN